MRWNVKADVADFEEECEYEYEADVGLKRKYVSQMLG